MKYNVYGGFFECARVAHQPIWYVIPENEKEFFRTNFLPAHVVEILSHLPELQLQERIVAAVLDETNKSAFAKYYTP